jgi:4-hydroxybenzoate polyprenyltransferase
VRGSSGVTESGVWRIATVVAFSRPSTCIPGMLAFYFATVISGGVPSRSVIVGLIVSYHIAAIANLYNMYTDIEEDNENIPSRVFELGLYGRSRLLRHTHVVTAVIFLLSCWSTRLLQPLPSWH